MKGGQLKGTLDIKEVLIILIVPLLLMIFSFIYGNLELSTQETLYTAVTGESINLSANDTYVNLANSPVVDDSEYAVRVYNTTNTLVEDTDYSVDYTNGKVKTINNKTGVYSTDYTHMGSGGYMAFDNINEQAYGSFGLASIIPVVIVGALVVGILLKLFVF